MVAKERIVKERREKRQEDGKTAVLYKAGKKSKLSGFFSLTAELTSFLSGSQISRQAESSLAKQGICAVSTVTAL